MAPIKNVALLGAESVIGPAIFHALITNGFNVTVLKRQSSKSQDTYPTGVTVNRVSDDFPSHLLAEALRGQDALVVSIKGTQVELQERLARTCVDAGVRRFIPADFGSCDSSSKLTQELVPLYKSKTQVRDTLIELAKQHPAFSWTSIVCGHFCTLWMLKVELAKRELEILDDGEHRHSLSTYERVGESVAKVLLLPDQTANRTLYVQSFLVTHNMLRAALEKATGGKEWRVVRRESKEYVETEKVKAREGDKSAVENLVWYLGTVDADWTTRDGYAMDVLGLRDEDLEKVVAKLVQEST